MPNGFSLHVGLSRVSEHVHGDAMAATGCDRAAEAMRAIAVERGFSALDPLIDEGAKAAPFLEALRKQAGRLAAGDILFISIAGHGILHVDTGIRDETRDQALLLFDKVLTDDELHGELERIHVDARVIAVAEACFSATILEAASREESREVRLWREHVTRFPVVTPTQLAANVLLLAAASEDDVAFGLAPAASGLPPFTLALLEVWRDATSYVDLHAKLVAKAQERAFPTAVLNRNLITDAAFVQQAPFTI